MDSDSLGSYLRRGVLSLLLLAPLVSLQCASLDPAEQGRTYRPDYAAGCTALRHYDWQRAEFWFREALDRQPRSFGPAVRWTGENSLLYLPRYVMGVSRFGLGRYGEALRDWKAAEEEWRDLSPRKAEALEPYRAVIRAGRQVYRELVCEDVVGLALGPSWRNRGSRATDGSDPLRTELSEIFSLCRQEKYEESLRRARVLAKDFERSGREVLSPDGIDEAGISLENIPVSFAEEISDCEPPRKLKRRKLDERGTTQHDGVALASWRSEEPLRKPISLAGMGSTVQREREAAGGKTLDERVGDVDRAYRRKIALLIYPDYQGMNWKPIPGDTEAIAKLKAGLLRWRFAEGDIQVLHTNATRAAIEGAIAKIKNDYAPLGASGSPRNLIFVYYLGHSLRSRNDDGYGSLVTSGSEPIAGVRGGAGRMVETSVSSKLLIDFRNNAPHHMVFLFDACSLGQQFYDDLDDPNRMHWSKVLRFPALLVLMRSAAGQQVAATPRLGLDFAKQLSGCGNVNPFWVTTGYDLLGSTADAVYSTSKATEVPQALKYRSGLWSSGDIVLRSPHECQRK